MMQNTLITSLLLSSALGFLDNIYIQLQDCCTYTEQSIIFIIDQHNQDYGNFKKDGKPNATIVSLYAAFVTGKDSIVVASQSVVVALYQFSKKNPTHFINRALAFHEWDLFVLEDFCICIHKSKNASSIGLNLKALSPRALVDIESNMPTRPLVFADEKFGNSKSFLSKLFAADRNETTLWSIYMLGHGIIDRYIAGLLVDDFKNTLYFFEHKIRTKILLYKSCFAGGANKESAFQQWVTKGFYRKEAGK